MTLTICFSFRQSFFYTFIFQYIQREWLTDIPFLNPIFFLNKKNYLCGRKFSLVTIHTHNTLPILFPTLLPVRVHDIQRCRTLNIAILTPKGMMLLKLKDRKNKINFNVSIKTFFTTPIKHKTYTNTHELFLS